MENDMNSILLVEDNKAIIMGLSYLFNENGYKTIVAENIEEAGKAPVVIAKGADYLAFQIKDKAKDRKSVV